MDHQLMKYLHVHIDHVDLNASVQMNDIFPNQSLNNDQNNRNLISNDHVDHYNHVKKSRVVFHRNNLKSKRNQKLRFLVLFTFHIV
jgi:hypothetical protein